jgi:protein-tyrosine phosphatase
LLLDLVPELGIREVPDPYYGGREGFDRVLDIAESVSNALIRHLGERLR